MNFQIPPSCLRQGHAEPLFSARWLLLCGEQEVEKRRHILNSQRNFAASELCIPNKILIFNLTLCQKWLSQMKLILLCVVVGVADVLSPAGKSSSYNDITVIP
jgi:hypothetical protein